MANRLMTGILVLLVVCAGALGYYSFTLNRQFDRLSERISVFEGEQKAQVQSISDNVSALKIKTESSLIALESQAAGVRSDINSIKTDLGAAVTRLTGAEEKISGVSSNIASLDKRVAGAEANVAGLSGSTINAGAVYDKAVRATVRITNGQATAGSGFIYDNTGRVVTAYHVVASLSPIYIMMYDGRISRASVLGYCPFSDVAVLKLDNNPSLEPLALADSGKIKIGQPAVAIGSPGDSDDPLALRDTLTSGIVSAVNRYVVVESLAIANLIQVDTAINFGNSGGPLIDSSGRVIGVVNARIDPTQGDGISWAIASNKVKRVAEAVISKGSFPYPWMGVGLSDLTPETVTQKGLETSNGALVGTVVNGGPAAAAGVQSGDVIVSVDGVAARNIADLTSYLGEFKSPGDSIVIELIRGTSKLKISVVVGTRPS